MIFCKQQIKNVIFCFCLFQWIPAILSSSHRFWTDIFPTLASFNSWSSSYCNFTRIKLYYTLYEAFIQKIFSASATFSKQLGKKKNVLIKRYTNSIHIFCRIWQIVPEIHSLTFITENKKRSPHCFMTISSPCIDSYIEI